MILEKITSVEDLRKLPPEELPPLAEELRQHILNVVSRQGGHLASSLGAADLILALHYVFDTPQDKLIFDVGHQAYVHKLLTGRKERFEKLREMDGCAGFPTPAEDPQFDPAVCGHAGTAISTALGLAQTDRNCKVIAVTGDGSLNCGISLEGLNNAKSCGKNLIVILNDNKMSISRNVGSIPRYLNAVISGGFYNRLKVTAKRAIRILPKHELIHRLIRRWEDLLKGLLLPGSFFEQLGLRYIGPLDGNDLPGLIKSFSKIKHLEGPLFIHVITQKGHGCDFAVKDPVKFHGVSGFDPLTGETPLSAKDSFSAAFGRAAVALAEQHKEVCAITAAMTSGTGLTAFARSFPDRFYDVGIAEEHAVAFAAGLAAGGRRPVCAVYATFMQRALDCIYHDVVLAKRPVIFALDRAGAVEDGPTHHGIYDLSFLRAMPGLTVMEPRNECELEVMLAEAYRLNAPVVIRYPRGGTSCGRCAIAPLEHGKAEIFKSGTGPVLWAAGAEVETALKVEKLLGMNCTVINTRYLAPFDRQTALRFAREGRLIVTIEDHVCTGGLASAVDETLCGVVSARVLHFGWNSAEILPHGKIGQLREHNGMTAEQIAQKIQDAEEKR
ncbi:MAG: 1-deoxy-D-xylulose-5-phosphate synthase [Lentisphaeria bacterium]|nr:1-deoxy-D-xylulose-5-phosphate synthase [Lentisphaeria bacterium]